MEEGFNKINQEQEGIITINGPRGKMTVDIKKMLAEVKS